MVTATSSMGTTRSSLELMLDKLQQIEEQPNVVPPALPARPVSRARPRRGRRNGERESCVAAFDGKERSWKKQDFAESDASAAQFLHFPKKTEELGDLKGGAEKGICKIQKCYRGHRVRCCYAQLTREVIALQSFIRGENARKGYEERCGIHRAIIIIQKQGRKYLEHQAALKHLQHSGSLDRRHRSEIEDETRVPVPYASLVDLQKRVVRTEAKLRAKKEENVALKRKLLEMENRWRTCEERMTFMEKEWQDQLTYIHERLAAAKKNPSPSPSPSPSCQTRFSNRFKSPDCCTVKSGIPKGRRLYNIPMNSNNYNNGADEEEMNEDGEEQVVCLKLRPHEELRKLKMRFKEWKKEYKNKLRDTQSTFNKLANTESSKIKSYNNWWGRLSN